MLLLMGWRAQRRKDIALWFGNCRRDFVVCMCIVISTDRGIFEYLLQYCSYCNHINFIVNLGETIFLNLLGSCFRLISI